MAGIVRISEVTLEHFKNVANGSINLFLPKIGEGASVLGIYGQNGSGKTALINALGILKSLMTGLPILKVRDVIELGYETANLSFRFEVKFCNENGIQECFDAIYSLRLKRRKDFSDEAGNSTTSADVERLVVDSEELRAAYEGPTIKHKLKTLLGIGSENKKPTPDTISKLLTNGDRSRLYSLEKIHYDTSRDGRSFIFSREFLQFLASCVKTDDSQDISLSEVHKLVCRLVDYGNFELMVLTTRSAGMITLGALPFDFKYEKTERKSFGSILVPIEQSVQMREDIVKELRTVIPVINVVLPEIIPNLSIKAETLNTNVQLDGTRMETIQLFSVREGRKLPLSAESEGIKKLISILHLMVYLFNNPSLTLAIDELDAGIFEYLLGNLISLIAERGKGQLIFTSHNLRPLELLPSKCICFSTVNPKNRYIHPTHVNKTNNLRSLYYRKILLGNSPDDLYAAANVERVALAMIQAGDVIHAE